MKNELKKHIKTFYPSTGWDGDRIYISIYLKPKGHCYHRDDYRYYYAAIKMDCRNPGWINILCKFRIRLLDYVVKHWGDKPWEPACVNQ